MATPATYEPGRYEPGRNLRQSYSAGDHVQQDPTAVERIKPQTALEQATRLPNTLDCSVKEFILRRLRSAEDDGEWEERIRVRVILDNVLFYRGQHWLYATEDCRIESSYEEDDDRDDLIIHNWYQFLVESKAKEWEAAKPRIEITPRASRDWRIEGAARLADALDRFTREPLIKAHFRQSEAKFGLLCKVYYRYSVLEIDDTDETASRLRVPITERKRFHLGAGYACPSCGHEWAEPDQLEGYGLDDDIPGPEMVCPGCGAAEQSEVDPRFGFEADVTVDEREEILPKIKHISVNPLSVKIDHRARRVQDSDYLICDTLERRYELESERGGRELDVPAAGGNLPHRLRAMLELERTTAGVDAFAFGDKLSRGGREDELIRRRRFWMMPKMYAHYRAQYDETVCGIEFKAGQRLGDPCPGGMLAVVLGDSEVDELAPESKNKRWAGSSFTLDPTTFHGKGTEDLNSIQMSIDDKATLAASHFDRAGAPSEIIDTRYVDMDEFDGSTAKRIPIKDTAPDTVNVDNVHKVVQAGQLGADFQNFLQQEPVVMREIFGVGRELAGLNDPNNKTARGREVAQAASSSMLIPSLALRAEEVEPETTFQNLEYWQQYGSDEDFAMFESEYGNESIEIFKKLNLRRDLTVRAAAGSWVPQTKDDELKNTEEFVTKYLVMANAGVGSDGQPVPGIPMAMVRYAASLYNIPTSVFEPERDVKLAQSRLARLRPWADEAYQSGITQLSPPSYELMLDQILGQPEFIPNPIMENHAVHMEFYADQWKGMYDDTNVNPVLLDLIAKMHDAHVTAIAEAQFKTQTLQLKAGAPEIAAGVVADETKQDEAIEGEREKQEVAAPKGPAAASAPQLTA